MDINMESKGSNIDSDPSPPQRRQAKGFGG